MRDSVSFVSSWCGQSGRMFYLCEFDDATQLDVPLMDSAAVLDDKVGGGDVSDKESPRGGGGVCSALAIKLSYTRIPGLYTQSAHPCDLRMKKTVYSLIKTNGVLTARQIGSTT